MVTLDSPLLHTEGLIKQSSLRMIVTATENLAENPMTEVRGQKRSTVMFLAAESTDNC